ncbi:MAG TPA: pitrilysin family protein [Allosphingosinicella sp.]
MRGKFALLLLSLLAFAPTAKAARTVAPTARPTAVPAIGYSTRTLPNGLRIYAIRDPSSPTVSLHAWYNVGSRDDPRGRTGFAHLFEHLMFRTTRNIPQGISAYLVSIGGTFNASTLFDYTTYYMSAPSNQLQPLLWVEGERLRNLVIDDAGFHAERGVVEEELRQRILAAPYGRILYTLLPAFTFTNHPYARPIGGSIAELESATLADVRAFHEAYYRPDNAIMVIAGNFDPAELDRWEDLYLGSIPRPTAWIPRDVRTEVKGAGPRTVDAYAPNVPLPAVIFSWRAPPATDPDRSGMDLIEAYLTHGPSARLRRALVDQRQIASSVSSYLLPARDGHAFALVETMAEGHNVAEGAAALNAEVARLRDQPVGAEELAAARNALLGEALSERETAQGRAFNLGDGATLTGDPHADDNRLATIARLTPADVQRIARRWLGPNTQVTIRYQNESARPAGYTGDRDGADTHDMGTIVPPASRPPVTIASDADRQQPPAAGPDRPRALPETAERRLPNGMRVIVAHSTDVPLATLELVVAGGDAADPHGKAGLDDLLAALAARGTDDLDATAFAQRIGVLGGSLAAASDPDATTVTTTVPLANAEAAGRLLAAAAMTPRLDAEDIDRVRRQQADALKVLARQPMQAAMRLAPAMTLGGDYGSVPTPASLAAITPADLVEVHRTEWRPERATLVITGAMTPAQGFALAENLFGTWHGTGPAAPAATPRVAPGDPRVLVLDMPNAGQTAVVAAVPAVGRSDPAWPALRIANARLGLGWASFLSKEIRQRRGLSYGAGSLTDVRRGGALILAATSTRNESAPEVVGLVLEQFRRLGTEAPSEADVAERASYLGIIAGLEIEHSAGLADYLAGFVASGSDLDAARAEMGAAETVPPAAVLAAAAADADPEHATIIVAGDARQWIDALRKRFPHLERISFEGAVE